MWNFVDWIADRGSEYEDLLLQKYLGQFNTHQNLKIDCNAKLELMSSFAKLCS
jgi:hypothetical protein